jgi:death-on-curing protein
LAEEVAALTESLANNHAFLDGNKRVAFDATHTFLLVNGFTMVAGPEETYVFITDSMAQGKSRLPVILDWINAHLQAVG